MNTCPRCSEYVQEDLAIKSKFTHLKICCNCHQNEVELLKVLKFLADPYRAMTIGNTLQMISFHSSIDTDTEAIIRGLGVVAEHACKNSGNIRLLSLEAEV